MSVKNLIAFLMLSRQNLNAVLTRLEGRGLVERVRDREDGRNRIIRLTAEGERTWDEVQGSIGLFYAKALKSLNEAEQTHLCLLLDRLRTGLNNV